MERTISHGGLDALERTGIVGLLERDELDHSPGVEELD
jgi:hypothetical protein